MPTSSMMGQVPNFGRGPYAMASAHVANGELQPGVMNVGGAWQVTCGDIADQWDIVDDDFGFIIHQSASDGSFLASFDLGVLSGLFRPLAGFYGSIASPNVSSAKSPISSSYIRFEWCGREMSEGEMQLPSSSRSGWMRFESDKAGQGWDEKTVAESYKGEIDTGFGGTCRFEGSRMDYTLDHELGERWEDYNENAYERERINRWH
ncbi:hypothetical protein K439DRAFT_439877 [Ramaria rubella]|nr:hypothetical protein K439DRAFT_439877 [Ramaria rubella]